MLVAQETSVFYPESDGKPMAETDLHRNLMFKVIHMLQSAFPQSYASGNLCLYYEEGNPRKMISPDSLLSQEQHPQEKRIYKIWEDGPIDLVVEISSFSTKREDHHKKKKIYEQLLEIPYYVIFDPLAIQMHVFELEDQKYILMEAQLNGHYPLKGLGIQIAIEDANSLRLFDEDGNKILTREEQAVQREEQAVQREEQAVQREEQAVQKEEQAVQREEQAVQREEQAVQEKEEVVQEVERLKALLKQAGVDAGGSH